MQAPIIFYGMPLSGYSAKTRIVLKAKGLAYEERSPPQGYRSQAYRNIVPMGTIPAIVVGDNVISESEVIAEYLEQRFAQPAMLPDDPQLRASVRFLSRFHDLYLEPSVRALFSQVNPRRRDAAIVRMRALEIEQQLLRLDQFIAPQPYALTAELSLGDCGFATTLPLAKMLLEALGHGLAWSSKIQSWLAALHEHPAVIRALSSWWPATGAWIAAQSDPKMSARSHLLDADWQYIEKASLEAFSADDWQLLNRQRDVYYAAQQTSQVLRLLTATRDDPVFGYQVNNYRHCLQSATMALRDGLHEEDIVVALLHDIGFVSAPTTHGEFAAALLAPYVSERNDWMLRHHALFQNIHCPTLPGIDLNAREQWRGHPYFQWTTDFVAKYDEAAIDPAYDCAPIDFFEPMVKRVFSRPPTTRAQWHQAS